ncbi:MAG: hypothetical protein U9N51_02115 [Bacteroidota bacterium]|nr:hypothetical protein [Bacteroidota bacterium]
MKKLIVLVAIISAFNISNGEASELKKSNTNETSQIELNVHPYGKTNFVPMTPIYVYAEYTVYRVKAEYLQNIPSCQPIGNDYHYFIYKNGAFLLTVNECNKDKIFSYLTNNYDLSLAQIQVISTKNS